MSGQFEPRKYRRVETHVRGLIENGEIPPGERVPVIDELCVQFDCTRQTVAKAYRELAATDLVQRVPGLGYYAI
jgi:DNA-binding GntR family transcriptional regulator